MDVPVSVIIPALNEAAGIRDTLLSLQPLRAMGVEVIVSDGGSTDGTQTCCAGLIDCWVRSPRGRAMQMNQGAAQARRDVLLFLHADTQLPDDVAEWLRRFAQSPGYAWGRFDVRLSGRHPLLRLVERLMNLRSRLTGIATGDQAMFARRQAFREVGGFPAIPLMEDIALSRHLKRLSRPYCVTSPLVTSSRRWEKHGVVRTILLMWWLRFLYFLGVAPERLARLYR